MEHERTFVIHWNAEGTPASPDPIFQSLPDIIRPCSVSVDSFRSWEEIDYWPSHVSAAAASLDYPTGPKGSGLLDVEVGGQQLGLTKARSSYDEQWARWLDHRILQARISDELVERDDTLDILVWGETKLGLLPLSKAGEDWFLRQKLSAEYVPIFDIIISLAGPEARLTDLQITIHSAVYSTEQQFIRLAAPDSRHAWLARFLNQSVGCFGHWFRKLIRQYPSSNIRWHASGFPALGSQLDPIFGDMLGPEEESWAADVG